MYKIMAFVLRLHRWSNELKLNELMSWVNTSQNVKIWYHILAIGWVLYLCTYAVPSVHINPLTGVKIKMAIIPVVTSSWIKRILYTFRINFIRMLLSEKDEPNPWGRASSSTLPLSFPPIVSNNDNNYVKFLCWASFIKLSAVFVFLIKTSSYDKFLFCGKFT